ncbi:porin [Pseudothauera rhizosphaerae]|uniref:Porin n=1 Tax=Pseudothauera rhizosphaerae TaxID=2565932 RepID=A0A4S4AER5_9RHOO|nr:porin [Pseudothauera rhizosphaerae]THF57648.1 porin [Pseudothauera rhizosphaerae]
MQKKLIALAVAGLVSAPAFAQSNVTIYGIVDIGFTHYSGSEWLDNRSGIDSGLQSGSRIGFRGVEDLGNGLKASFVLEESIGVDLGTGGNYTRQAFLALSGGFGTVAAGRQYTPQFLLLGKVDPFETGTVGDINYGRGVYLNGAFAAPDTIRLNNLLAYISPSFGGFNVIAGYTRNGLGDEELTVDGADSGDAKIWAINPNYSNGPLFVGLNYHQVKIDAGDYKDKVWDLGAAYDFGPVRLSAVYGQLKTDSAVTDFKTKQWLIGASVPVGTAGKVLASYARNTIDADGAPEAKARKWALGYTHDLSKRTNLYAAYAKINTNDEADGLFSVYKGSLTTGVDYAKGLNVGIRHKF